MAPEISAFEARRRANVANNQKLLKDTKEIGASMRKAAAPAPRPAPSASASRKRRRTEPVQRTRVMPTRQSRRLAGGDAVSGLGDIKPDDIPAELQQPQQAKRTRISGDLALAKLQVEGQRWSNGEVLATFSQGAQPGVRTFTEDDIKDSGDEKLMSLRKGMNELKMYEGWQPNGQSSQMDVLPSHLASSYFISSHLIPSNSCYCLWLLQCT